MTAPSPVVLDLREQIVEAAIRLRKVEMHWALDSMQWYEAAWCLRDVTDRLTVELADSPLPTVICPDCRGTMRVPDEGREGVTRVCATCSGAGVVAVTS